MTGKIPERGDRVGRNTILLIGQVSTIKANFKIARLSLPKLLNRLAAFVTLLECLLFEQSYPQPTQAPLAGNGLTSNAS